MPLRYWLLAAVFCLTAFGCGTNDAVLKRQTETEARLEQLIQSTTATNARLAEMATELREVQNQVKANSADLAVLKPGYQEVKSSVATIAQKVDGKSLPSNAAKIVVVNKGGVAGDRESVEQDAYMKAFGLFSTNDYKGAIEAFEAFIRSYPASEYSGNARYWIGECLYTEGDYEKALEAFKRVIEQYPEGGKVSDAMLKVGLSLINLNQPEKARKAFEELVEKYPKSQAAAKARERLSRN